MTTARAVDAALVCNDSAAPRGPDTLVVTNRVEQWRCSKDVLYRFMTTSDAEELISYIYGLVGGGADPEARGLLLERYGDRISPGGQDTLARIRRSHTHNTPLSPFSFLVHTLGSIPSTALHRRRGGREEGRLTRCAQVHGRMSRGDHAHDAHGFALCLVGVDGDGTRVP